MKSKILIVDDSMTYRAIMSSILKDHEIILARDGFEALNYVKENDDIDLVILDINMPNMDGFEFLENLNKLSLIDKMTVLILTGEDESENELRGLDLGAMDYIRKPINFTSIKKRVDIHLNLREEQMKIAQDNEKLEEKVEKRTKELVLTRDITIHALIGLLEVRNIESSNHTIRTQHMMRILCEHLKSKCKFKNILKDSYIKELFKTAPLHDIGKVGIPDRILLKPGKLTVEEFEIMKKHTIYGVEALTHDLEDNEELPNFIKTAIEIAGTHHEKFDGTGYPYGLSGTEIPLPGRLMAIIDVYDALLSKRVYKPAYNHQYAIDMIISESGKHFDPDIVEGFLEVQEAIFKITRDFVQKDNCIDEI